MSSVLRAAESCAFLHPIFPERAIHQMRTTANKTAILSLVSIVGVSLAGCAQLPLDGPAHRDIDRGATVQFVSARDQIAYDYALIDVTPVVLDSLPQKYASSFQSIEGKLVHASPAAEIGVGDVLQVTIFESAVGGLFLPADSGPRPANAITIPSQTVLRSGEISVPYAGKIRAAGRSIPSVARDIQARLSSRAIEPQVVITLVEQNAATVSVIGDTLVNANRFKLTGSADRVLDMVARAGGTRFPGYELFVTLVRQNHSATINFSRLISDPDENILVQPNDIIYVYRQQQKYVAIGALGSSSQTSGVTGQFTFDQERLSLNEAIARAGGLLDTRADPGMVFVYRIEHRSTLEHMGVNLSGFPTEQLAIPTIYRLNFRDPSSFFTAQRFTMRDGDAIYAANSDSVEMRKFFDHARAITSTVAGVASDVSLVGNIIKGNTGNGN